MGKAMWRFKRDACHPACYYKAFCHPTRGTCTERGRERVRQREGRDILSDGPCLSEQLGAQRVLVITESL